MELSLLLIRQIASMFIMIFLGFLTIKTKLLSQEDGKVLSKTAVYIVAPCMAFASFQIDFSSDKLLGLGIAAAAAVAVHLIYMLISRAISSPLRLMNIERASLIYSNSGNMIIPLITNVLGSEWVFYSSAYITVQTLLIWTHGKSLVQGKKDWSLKQVIFNPNIISVTIALIFFLLRVTVPRVINTAMSSVGAMIGPLCMFVVGMLIAGMDLRSLMAKKRAFLICAGRLVIYPSVIAAVFSAVARTGIHPDLMKILLIVLLAASSPSASTVTQFAQIYDAEPEYSSIINVTTTLLCIVTMPPIVMLYQLLTGM